MIGSATFWLPRRSSTIAADVDWNWNLVYWVSVFFLVLVGSLIVYFLVRFRNAKEQPTASHNTPLELTWTVIPTLIVVVMFWNGYKTFLDMATPPSNAYEIQVIGQKWTWQFAYPNGYIDGTLHVPAHTPVTLVMSSQDVIHAFFVPEFRVKRDVMPGRYSKVWFEAIETGTFNVFCAEYCGRDHFAMRTEVIVHEAADFDRWLAEASDFLNRMPPAEAGAMLVKQRGCRQCHSLDGSPGTGPTFENLFGSQAALAGGASVEVDENYVRESILAPQAKIVAGYQPVMPSYKGRVKDEEIAAMIEYLKTLARQDG